MKHARIVGKLMADLGAVAIVAGPSAAFACPVCFGMLEGPMADAANSAVFALLGVTAAVLMGFGAFIVYLVRRAQAVIPVPGESEAARAGAGGSIAEGSMS